MYVIDEAHMVSTQGFNALLKLVEEPPEYVEVLVFATTEPEKVLGIEYPPCPIRRPPWSAVIVGQSSR